MKIILKDGRTEVPSQAKSQRHKPKSRRKLKGKRGPKFS